jgi:hypothetical protein
VGSTLFTTSCGGTGISNFNSTGPVCIQYKGNVTGWNSNNSQGRTITASGATTVVIPGASGVPNQPGITAGADGYVYWNFTAGTYSYAGMSCW